MGKHEVRGLNDCLTPKKALKVKDLIAKEEIDADEVVYEVTKNDMRKLSPEDTIKPGGEYGVVPGNVVG